MPTWPPAAASRITMSADPELPRGAQWSRSPLDWARSAGEGDRLLAALARRESRVRRRRLALSGMLLVAVAAGFGFLRLRSSDFVASGTAAVATARPPQVSAPVRRTLPDGTRVELKPGSELVVLFTATGPGRREVALRSGEAHFEVAHDAARPFVVRVGAARFRAVGTAFSVALAGELAEMHVTAGRVAVDAPGAPEPLAIVAAGQRAVLSALVPDTPVLAPVPAEATTERFAWRVPRIEFNETPLEEVVAQLNQHGPARLRLIGRDLRRLEITGALRADNVEPLLRSLEQNYGIRVSRLPGAFKLCVNI